MTALEIRLILYSLAGLLLIGGSVWLGYHFTREYYVDQIERTQAAQAQALSQAQQAVIAAQNTQQAASQAAEKQYADLSKANGDLSNRLASSLQNYTQLRGGIVSATSTAAAAVNAASEGTRRNTELVGLVRQATDACLGDAAQLTALETWAKVQ